MGMWRSAHKKRKLSPPSTAPQRAGSSFKVSSGNEPGKIFRDPQGKPHVVPNKTRRKRADRKERL